MIFLKDAFQILIAFHVSVQIIVQVLEYDHNVLAEFETIHKLNDPLSTLTLSLHEFFEKSYFNICVVDVELFIFANFSIARIEFLKTLWNRFHFLKFLIINISGS